MEIDKDLINDIMGIVMAGPINDFAPVLVRTVNAGVHFGYLQKEEFTPAGKVVTLLKSRRAYFWAGAATLSQMALEGVKKPKDCKFTVEIPIIEIVNVIETMPLTKESVVNLYAVPVWKNS